MEQAKREKLVSLRTFSEIIEMLEMTRYSMFSFSQKKVDLIGRAQYVLLHWDDFFWNLKDQKNSQYKNPAI